MAIGSNYKTQLKEDRTYYDNLKWLQYVCGHDAFLRGEYSLAEWTGGKKKKMELPPSFLA